MSGVGEGEGLAVGVLAVFTQPLPIEGVWWWFSVPLVAAVAVVYKTLKVWDLRRLPAEASVLVLQVFAVMLGLWGVLELVAWLGGST